MSHDDEYLREIFVNELVQTERKYVQDLGLVQEYSIALSQRNIINQDSFDTLFPNIEQRWGQVFFEGEEGFVENYGPPCANYNLASELLLEHEQSLAALNHLINVRSELPAFLIKPVGRVCKYPLLLDSLLKSCDSTNYPYYQELKAGLDAHKRVTDRINDIMREAENEQTVKNLLSRIEDWKGHQVENFGKLLLDDIFIVTRSDVDREYRVFLFQKILLCCKETSLPDNVETFRLPSHKSTALLLKGRVFVRNVTRIEPQLAQNSTDSTLAPVSAQYPLSVWWKGDTDEEFFTLRCRSEDQRHRWESVLVRSVGEAQRHKGSDSA